MGSYVDALFGEGVDETFGGAQPHRVLLFGLVGGALRAEAGVQERKQENKRTDYYAGRRAGFICGAAQLMATLYGGDYEAAKHALSAGVRAAGETATLADLREPDTQAAMAREIAERSLPEI